MELSDFCLKRLFNPDNSEFLPIEEQIKFYKQRDLTKSKNYGAILRILGQPKSRRRIIIAPPMKEASGREILGRNSVKYLSPLSDKPVMAEPEDRALSQKEKEHKHQIMLKERTDAFHNWLDERKDLRNSLDKLCLTEQWLLSKDKTPLEQKVYLQMRDARLAALGNNKKKKIVEVSTPDEEVVLPKIKRPLPETMDTLIKYLAMKRVRIIDLFSRADKNKNWTISRKEFRKCLKEANIEMAPHILDDLVEGLDQDYSGEIDYKELANGIKKHKIEKRRVRKFLKTQQQNASGTSNLTVIPTIERTPSAGSASSRFTHSSCGSHLEVPQTDISEQLNLSPDDLLEKRKRERHIRKTKKNPSKADKVKTNVTVIDGHSRRSTFAGEIGESIDRFREERLREYHKVLRLCNEHAVSLTPRLLQKALLHPGDKPHRSIKLKTTPGHLHSSYFADPPQEVKQSTKTIDEDQTCVSSTGEVLIEARHGYPRQDDVKREPRLMTLSSGKAFISRKVDCWMTFEEYTELTRHLAKRYISLEGEDNSNVFWPGHMLDKLLLYLPRYKETQCVFSSTHQSKPTNLGYNNHLQSWPISNEGYVKVGDIDQLKCYSLQGR